MIARGADRRWRARALGQLLAERRDGLDRRAMTSTVVRTGAVRTGFGEATPRRERRRFPESGME